MKDRFSLVFISAATLTGLCGLLMVAIALYAPTPLTPATAAVFETLKYGFTVGMLSIFALLGPSPRSRPPRM
jgi:hypothetical protein